MLAAKSACHAALSSTVNPPKTAGRPAALIAATVVVTVVAIVVVTVVAIAASVRAAATKHPTLTARDACASRAVCFFSYNRDVNPPKTK
jgi:threonine/homoserine/homoserine lactone efflux protein